MSKGIGQKIAIKFTEGIVEPTLIGDSSTNLALGRPYTSNGTIDYRGYSATDGNTATANYIEVSGTDMFIEVDLQAEVYINSVKVWHYYSDARIYNNAKTEISLDGYEWHVLYDSNVNGTYAESSAGKEHSLETPIKARYIRDWLNGSNKNTGNHWVEIMVFGSFFGYLAEGFNITGKEYKYVNGPLLDKEYQVDKVERYGIVPIWNTDTVRLNYNSFEETTEQLPELQSTHADAINRTANRGTSTTNTIQGSNEWIYRTFLQHDLSAIEGKNIKNASLNLYSHSWNDSAAGGTTNISRVMASWDEMTLTWNNQPATTGTYLASNVSPIPANTWGSWDITNLVLEWSQEYSTYYGLLIKNNNEGAYRYNWSIRNRKYGEGDFSTYIEVTYDKEVYDGSKTQTFLAETSDNMLYKVKWLEDKPINTDITVEYTTGTEQGEWIEVSNGDVITSDTNLWFRVTLETTDTSVTPTLQDLWIEEANAPDDQIRLVMHPQSRFNNVEGDLTVDYDASKGNLQGRGGAVESFSYDFTPVGLETKPNPHAAEIITITPYADIPFTRVYYRQRYGSEKITATANATVVFTYVGIINP